MIADTERKRTTTAKLMVGVVVLSGTVVRRGQGI